MKSKNDYRVLAGDPSEAFTVANCWSGPFAPERHIATENARLIASAPELLAILEDFPGFYTDEHARRIWTERRNAILAKMPS